MGYPNFSNNPDVSPVTVASVVITASPTSDRFMAGKIDGVSAAETTIPQLFAKAYDLAGAEVLGQSFHWESSNPCVAAVDQSGNVTRVENTEDRSFDSNGIAVGGRGVNQYVESNLGGISVISATWLRGDGSQSGVRGEVKVAIQAQGNSALQRAWNENVVPPTLAADGVENVVRRIVVLDNITNLAGVVNYNNETNLLGTYPNMSDD